MTRLHRKDERSRRGNILVLTAFMIIGMFGFLAMSIDLGYLATARSELQKSADAAAMAAAWELMDRDSLSGTVNLTTEIANARAVATQYAAANRVCNSAPGIDVNNGNSAGGDILVGYLSDPADPSLAMDFSNPNRFNAVRVRVRRTSAQNGEVPFFFARALGHQSIAAQAEATAALVNNFGGFRTPSDGGNLDILPIALDLPTWQDLLAGGGSDCFSYNNTTKELRGGSDGVREVNLYPEKNGSPGNRGTVDIGNSNNSTSDLSRQIRTGITQADLNYIGGELKFNNSGELYLNGDTGISAGIKDDLQSIMGQPRIIPIFSQVSGNGNNANYTIVQFVGVRVVEVQLTGKNKRVTIQPATVLVRGGIPTAGSQKSYFVYSPAWLVR